MAECGYNPAFIDQGGKDIGHYLEEWFKPLGRPAILKKTVHLTDETLDKPLESYKVTKNMQLTSVAVQGKANLIECGGIKTISAGQLHLKGSKVSGDVTVREGDLRIENSEVKGTITFGGQNAVLKTATIAKLVLRIAEGRDSEKYIRKLVMNNCTIGELVIIRGQNPVDMVTKGTDVTVTITD